MITGTTQRRIQVINRCLRNPNLVWNHVRAYTTEDSVSIGAVTKSVRRPKLPQYVPRKYYNENQSQTTLHQLRWMMQKDLLGQDIFLLGPPGPRRRHLAMQYLELTDREHEYVALSRDTTESDLKQRREIVRGTAKYFDQSAVRAATEGRILVLEGIEKAERNVLPVLNNLLENREMQLEDGRLLIPADRYDKLLEKYSKDELERLKLVRVAEDFRVIALGLPVPKYRGNPLDPPLRSRFQARDVNVNNYQEWLQELRALAPNAPSEKIEQLLSVAFGLISKESATLGLPDFPVDNLPRIARILEQHPHLPVYDLIYRMYPYRTFLKEGVEHLENLLASFKVTPQPESLATEQPRMPATNTTYVANRYQDKLIKDMLQTIAVADFCVVGPRGCGKSILVDRVAELLGKEVETIVLYQDMTSRDLVQQRTTLDNGDTVWKFSPLVNAALEGRIAVLDGLHRIHPSTLSVLHRLVHDRELQLHDGRRMISSERYDVLKKELGFSDEVLADSGVLRIHPDFRIVAVAEPPPSHGTGINWLSPEVLNLFLFHEARMLDKTEEMHIITSKYGPISKPLLQIVDLAQTLRNSPDSTLRNLSGHLSTRQLLRIASRMQRYPSDNAYDAVENTFMLKFLPTLPREALERTMSKLNLVAAPVNEDGVTYNLSNGSLRIGNTTSPIYETTDVTKVPQILFYDVPQHLSLMERLLQDFQLGQHLLLVGNQGVGKNKIVDRFLQLLNRPREYIQLHRDTTVQTLTVQPTVKDGLLVHEDSPLVKAIKHGRVLVIDEADKAPTHVTCILKTLVETGRMVLSDGRRIVKDSGNDVNCIVTHPDFRIVVLANRPGFPFLGNDFFGALGDLFSSHAVDNPSRRAEIDMLRQYGPDVPVNTLRKLVDVFGELRALADQGLVNYPYSTREVVNIVKHLQKFPSADLEDVMFNVFDFDKYSPEMVETVGQVLIKHGFPNSNVFAAEYVRSKRAKEHLQVTKSRHSGLDTKEPKHGKEDPKNDPHVGGNTWAGGTGGRDTAGLGGKGGPYRLDKGHEVHQLSDEEKAAVPEHVQRAAREMGRKALEEKLKEIGMSGYDASLYSEFSSSVQRHIQSLRIVLGTLHAKNKERHWSRHQTSGELDDVKLIDGILGEKTIFRRRAEQDPELGTPQTKPKMFRLVVDVSGSMYRFNGYDGRLDRELEAVVLVMEAFEGFDDKLQYDIIGHSGDTDKITFVKKGEPPKNNKERLDVLRAMHAHSQFCWSGDHTLEATELAVTSLTPDDHDESIVVVLSDANLSRYSIPASKLAKALTAEPKVSGYAVFIGGLGDQAERLVQNMPAGRAFVCTDVARLPQILKQIFSSSILTSNL